MGPDPFWGWTCCSAVNFQSSNVASWRNTAILDGWTAMQFPQSPANVFWKCTCLAWGGQNTRQPQSYAQDIRIVFIFWCCLPRYSIHSDIKCLESRNIQLWQRHRPDKENQGELTKNWRFSWKEDVRNHLNKTLLVLWLWYIVFWTVQHGFQKIN